MKIIIIKLGALGDVVRTIPVLEAIKDKYPNSEITWITKENAKQLFEGNPYVKQVFTIPFQTKEKFDLLYNFDIEESASKIALSIEADKKLGFYNEGGYAAAFNLGAEYYINTVFDDYLKKTNRRNHQEMIFEAGELEYKKEMPKIYFNEDDKAYAEEFIKENNINTKKLIGIHMGAAPTWPSKAWAEEKIKGFIVKAKERKNNIIVFGGPNEIEKIEKLLLDLKKSGIIVYKNNPKNSIKEFASLVDKCEKMICSDSFSLHIALALNKPTVGLFFCTSPHEIEGYGLLKKLVAPRLNEFFPEKMDEYNEELINSISVNEVLNAVDDFDSISKV